MVRAQRVAALEGLEQPFQLVRCDTDTGVDDVEGGGFAQVAQPQRDTALVGVAHRVAEQVDEDLPHPFLVTTHHRRHAALRLEGECQALFLCLRIEHLPQLLEKLREGNFAGLEVQLAGLDLGDVEQTVDQRQQVRAAAVDGAQRLLVPTGGGGLLSGIAIATKALAPTAQVVGVELEVSHPFRTSLIAGRIAEITVGESIADGLSGNLDPTTITFALVKKFVDNTVVVSEGGLRKGIYGLVANEQLIAEGAGIAAVAALLESTVNAADQTVVAIVSGANIDVERLTEILSEG